MFQSFLVSTLQKDQFTRYTAKVYECISFLQNDYPGFESWYWDKVVKDVARSQREIIIKKDRETIIAVAILKMKPAKICCFVVFPPHQHIGLGKELMEESMRLLEADKPLLTVSSKRIKEYQPLLKDYGFELYEEIQNCYRMGTTEYVFNGFLTKD